jgi:hypothetical protein
MVGSSLKATLVIVLTPLVMAWMCCASSASTYLLLTVIPISTDSASEMLSQQLRSVKTFAAAANVRPGRCRFASHKKVPQL